MDVSRKNSCLLVEGTVVRNITRATWTEYMQADSSQGSIYWFNALVR